jgi:HemK-like putative methylase
MNKEGQWLLQEKYKGEKCSAFFTDLELLKSGTPLAYLIGSIPFLDCTIYLDSHPLIPRVETEYWTEKAISEILKVRGATPYFYVLDLCAGSGAIGIAVAKAVAEARVDFAEINPAHIPNIKENVQKNTIIYDSEKYQVIESDLFENITQKYDFILTNPPYIDPNIDRTEESVKMYEPVLALYGGTDGMECIQKIIEDAPMYLIKHGQLWIEHEPEQSIAIQELAKINNFTYSTHNDQYGVERYSILVLQ